MRRPDPGGPSATTPAPGRRSEGWVRLPQPRGQATVSGCLAGAAAGPQRGERRRARRRRGRARPALPRMPFRRESPRRLGAVRRRGAGPGRRQRRVCSGSASQPTKCRPRLRSRPSATSRLRRLPPTRRQAGGRVPSMPSCSSDCGPRVRPSHCRPATAASSTRSCSVSASRDAGWRAATTSPAADRHHRHPRPARRLRPAARRTRGRTAAEAHRLDRARRQSAVSTGDRQSCPAPPLRHEPGAHAE